MMMEGAAAAQDTLPVNLPDIALERDEHAANVLRLRKVAALSLVAWPLFGLVDWFIVSLVHPGRLWVFLALRAVGMVLVGLAAARLFARPLPSARLLRTIDLTVFTAFSALISASCVEFRGIASPLSLGVVILILARGVMIAEHWKRALLPTGLAAGVHPVVLVGLALVSPEVAGQLGDSSQVAAFALNQLFVLGAAAIALAGGHVVWALRRQVFEARSLGRYRLKRRIGQGGVGEVWSAHHRTLKRDVAVKILRPDRRIEQRALARFLQEVRATAALTHPNTVRVFDFGVTDDGICYFAMELLEGEDLGQLLRREGPLDPARALRLAIQAARALAEAHARGIVHRDVKPENLFVMSVAGQTDVVKVLDFGMARLLEPQSDQGLTSEGFALGTPSYISPEVLRGLRADPGADVYALGAVLYHMISGGPPFQSADVHEVLMAHLRKTPQPLSERRLAERLAPGIERVVMRCLRKKPALRYPSAKELAEALEACLARMGHEAFAASSAGQHPEEGVAASARRGRAPEPPSPELPTTPYQRARRPAPQRPAAPIHLPPEEHDTLRDLRSPA